MSKHLPMISKMAMRKSKPCLGRPPLWLALVLCVAAGAYFGTQAHAQQMQMPPMMSPPMQLPDASSSQVPGPGHSPQIPQMKLPVDYGPGLAFQDRRIKALNSARQKKLISDTNKLLKLTAKLNAQISQEQAGSFTPEQLRMLARIEKLAKSVRDKMSNPIQLPHFRNDFPPTFAPASMP